MDTTEKIQPHYTIAARVVISIHKNTTSTQYIKVK